MYYFVSFSTIDIKTGNVSIGRSVIHLEKPISSIRDIIYMEKSIAADRYEYKKSEIEVNILFWRRFEEKEGKEK